MHLLLRMKAGAGLLVARKDSVCSNTMATFRPSLASLVQMLRKERSVDHQHPNYK